MKKVKRHNQAGILSYAVLLFFFIDCSISSGLDGTDIS